MKKHVDNLAKTVSADLSVKATEIRKEITDLVRGVRIGDVQNYKMINVKKKELARVLTRVAREDKEKK